MCVPLVGMKVKVQVRLKQIADSRWRKKCIWLMEKASVVAYVVSSVCAINRERCIIYRMWMKEDKARISMCDGIGGNERRGRGMEDGSLCIFSHGCLQVQVIDGGRNNVDGRETDNGRVAAEQLKDGGIICHVWINIPHIVQYKERRQERRRINCRQTSWR